MATEPRREHTPKTACCCRLTWNDNGRRYTDTCPRTTSGPDEPFCQGCIAEGHPDEPNFDPIIKVARHG